MSKDKTARLTGGAVGLLEAHGEPNVREIKIISPGWGSSGYYSAAVLERDAGVYSAGTQMFWDHPTESEEWERPERSLRDLAGKLITGGEYHAEGKTGPGVYAKALIYKDYVDAVNEMASDIGISHRAVGLMEWGEVDGQEGPIVKEIVQAVSVDFVTLPGRGGEVLPLFEAARRRAAENRLKQDHEPLEAENDMEQQIEDLKAEVEMYKEEIERLEAELAKRDEKIEALEDEIARMGEARVVAEAAGVRAEKIAESDLPDVTKARLEKSLERVAPVNEDGSLDREELEECVAAAIKTEVEYLEAIRPASGVPYGVGASEPAGESEALLDRMKEGWIAEGYTEAEVERMARAAR